MPRKRNVVADQVEKAAKTPKAEPQTITVSRRNLLSTGSTMLNLACSGNPFGGFLKGKYYFLVGDSQSGKTFLSMTCFAEATVNRHFRDYDLIYDNVEDGCLIDLEALFNEQVADRIRPPALDGEGNAVYSSTIEEFYYHVDDACDSGRPFIYVLDSMDALDSEAADKKFDQHKKAHDKSKDKDDEDGGKEEKVAGSYGDGKAKKNSEGLRRVINRIRETGSILIIVSQTRDNLNAFSFEKKTRSGGKALRFYATTEIWSSVEGAITRTVKGKKRKVGINVILDIKKNRITGKLAQVRADIYPSYGIDDIGSMVDYLVGEGYWHGSKGNVNAPQFDHNGTREALIRAIEDQGRVDELKALVGQCWQEIDEACALKRKKRYDTSVGTD